MVSEVWKQMIRIKNGKGFYDLSYVDGWFISFFLFNKEGDIKSVQYTMIQNYRMKFHSH